MRKSTIKSWLSLVLCLALLAAAALCNVSLAETAAETEEAVILMTGTQEEPVELGEQHTFLFEVVYEKENVDAWFKIHTSEATLGKALQSEKLIAGSDSEWGMFVTSVCGIEVEIPVYWMLYINGTMS